MLQSLRVITRTSESFAENEDREQIEDPSILFKQRYDRYREEHGIFYDEETTKGIRAAFAGVQHVSSTLAGGEVLRLGPDRLIDVLRVPGHSQGHLALYDRRHRVLFYDDAIHGSGYRATNRSWVCWVSLAPIQWLGPNFTILR